MIDESGNARITDFGLAKIIRGSHSLPSTSEGHGPTLRWTAPEIFESGKMVGEETDIYSFAMVTIEVREPSIFAISPVSPVEQDFYWGRPVQRIQVVGSGDAYYTRGSSGTTQSPRVYGEPVEVNSKVLGRGCRRPPEDGGCFGGIVSFSWIRAGKLS